MALLPTKKITALTPFTPPLTGDEEFECVQIGNSRKVTSRAFVLPTDALLTFADIAATLPGSRRLIPGTGIQIDLVDPNRVQISMLGTGALPADPSSAIGLTMVPGVAPTWMRSDAAPPLDQTIEPVWTGNHTFEGNQNIVSNLLPQWFFRETDASADNQTWLIRISGEQFNIGALNDLGSVFNPWVTVDRTLAVIDTVNLQATSLLWNGSPILSAGTAFANPTASVGLAAVNGVSTTAMRSDAAPPLSQAIAPTWTGIHTHAAATRGKLVSHATGANQALDLATTNCFYETLGDNTAFTFTNPPAAGREMTFTIYLLQDGAGNRVPTWPASVHWSDGLTPVLTTTAGRLDAVTLTTVDGGVTYYGGQVLANVVP
jgi:hypothetical protein